MADPSGECMRRHEALVWKGKSGNESAVEVALVDYPGIYFMRFISSFKQSMWPFAYNIIIVFVFVKPTDNSAR